MYGLPSELRVSPPNHPHPPRKREVACRPTHFPTCIKQGTLHLWFTRLARSQTQKLLQKTIPCMPCYKSYISDSILQWKINSINLDTVATGVYAFFEFSSDAVSIACYPVVVHSLIPIFVHLNRWKNNFFNNFLLPTRMFYNFELSMMEWERTYQNLWSMRLKWWV